MTVPTRIWQSFKGDLTTIKTNQLEFVEELLTEVQNGYGFHVAPSDITLHTTEHAEALITSPDLPLAEIAAQLSRCANLPEATLVGEGDKQYLKLKESYVLGNEELGRYIVRPIYKELCGRLGRGDVRKWVVTDGVELLAADSKELVKACANSETIYIVDGRAPMHCRAWTLLLTSPEPEHYKRILKESSSF
ncbi:hypothetical protein PCASD_19830 [Puccinia coronata f. sp. avenae]|uniref:Uncharacterized protein n=1 Tax=Puccinia coronata f. sp. avenae TaxID=200324 RepID=A0A2N5SDF1_9BASI|nr:hypothetical protein PCASD_19830 [Puccinia coronata f. sp. avenae]